MNTTASSITSVLIVAIVSASFASAHDEFENYVRVYNKTYKTVIEASMRREIYLKNKHFIDGFNAEQAESAGFKMGENHLTDLSEAEIATRSGARAAENLKPNSDRESREFLANLLKKYPYSEVPEELDWRKVPGRVSGVRDQGSCGSDWAFSATGALEGQMMLNSSGVGHLVKLSEQNLVDCSVNNDGCASGIMFYAWLDIMNKKGIEAESDYQYTGVKASCKFVPSMSVITDAGYQLFEIGWEDGLKDLVATFGPVSVMVDAAHSSFAHYSDGIYFEPNCRTDVNHLNHALLIVGYGTDSKTNSQYWIAKNSWGTQWGESGYIRLARNRANNCGVASQFMVPDF